MPKLMKLISLPDNKMARPFFTLGKIYETEYWSSNGVIVIADNGEKYIMLNERFDLTSSGN